MLDPSDEEEEEEEEHANGYNHDIEAGDGASLRRKSSKRSSEVQPLLRRTNSSRSDTQEHEDGGSFSQKLYIENEDLTMVIAGFNRSTLGYAIYIAICILTVGIGYLVFRWLPKWRVRLVGSTLR